MRPGARVGVRSVSKRYREVEVRMRLLMDQTRTCSRFFCSILAMAGWIPKRSSTLRTECEQMKLRNSWSSCTNTSVHGGTNTEGLVVTRDHPEALQGMDDLSSFAPLHVSRAAPRWDSLSPC
jgi:hypothetical protein